MADTLQDAISTVVGMKLKTTETLADDGSVPAATASNRKPIHSAWDNEETLDGTTTPDLDWFAQVRVTLSSGSATLDLTSFTDVNGRSRDATGKKLVFLRVENVSSNNINVAPGASNTYAQLFGTGNDVDVPAGCEVMKRILSGNSNPHTAVSASLKEIDFSGSGSDSCLVTLGMGD
jgi:hypothetical protein